MNALLRLPAVLQITGHSRSAWYRDIKEGRAPRPIKRGKVSLWPLHEVMAIVDKAIAEGRR